MPTHPMQSPMPDIESGFRRNSAVMPDYIIYRMNKKLRTRSLSSDNMWWDAFAADFFEDDATLTIIKLSPNDDSRNRLTIGRTLIPRFFRSMFDRGVTDLYFILNQPRDSVARSIITMECDDAAMVSDHGSPCPLKVYTEGKLTLDLTCDDSMRIRRWMFAIKNHKEYMQVNANENGSYGVSAQVSFSEGINKSPSRRDLLTETMKYLRMCVTLQLMQELMSKQKSSANPVNPRECLNLTVLQKSQVAGTSTGMAVPVIPQQSIVKPQELSHTSIPVPTIDESSGLSQNKQSQAKKRKRRASTTTGNSNISSTKKKSPDAPNVVMPSQDVMIVGEPSLMGGDLGEDDERMITRLVNTQYDGSNGLDDEEYRGSPIETTHMSSWNSDRKTAQDDKGMD